MLSLIFLVIPSSLADFCVSVGAGNDAHLSCPTGQIINEITFASYGQPGGCPSPSHNPKCDQQPQSLLVANTMCLNHTSCDIETVSVIYGDPCYGSRKAFAATWTCAAGEPPPVKPTLWGGVGYNILNHNFLEATDPAFAINGTLVRDIWMNRWKSINASFVRMVHPTNFWNFSIPRVLPYLQAFRDVTKTTIYWTTFHPVQPNVSDPTAVAAWATERTDFLTSLITADSQGFADILDFYCALRDLIHNCALDKFYSLTTHLTLFPLPFKRLCKRDGKQLRRGLAFVGCVQPSHLRTIADRPRSFPSAPGGS